MKLLEAIVDVDRGIEANDVSGEDDRGGGVGGGVENM
jgi:hypothetical protein